MQVNRNQKQQRNRYGFTLVELVVVILVLGIIAAVAAPKMFNTAGDARNSSARQSLVVVRDAIELYRSQNGSYPGTDEASFKAAIETMIHGSFPSCPVGNQDASVKVETAGTPLTVSGSDSWKYDNVSGEFIINDASYAAW